jgi:hypothetical protein
MKVWLKNFQRKGKPEDRELLVVEYLYDKSPFFQEFLQFKEGHLENDLIPYIRYYRQGDFIGESNYVPSRAFLKTFDAA